MTQSMANIESNKNFITLTTKAILLKLGRKIYCKKLLKVIFLLDLSVVLSFWLKQTNSKSCYMNYRISTQLTRSTHAIEGK